MDESPRFTVRNEHDVLLEVYGVNEQARGAQLPYTPDQRRTLSQLVDAAVRSAIGAGQYLVNGNTVQLVIKPELQEALKSGAARLSSGDGSFAANLIRTGEGGGIAGNLRFKPADAAKVANLAAVAWQVAAVVTAQHYMQEIDGKLNGLSEGVRGISEFLNNQQNAALAAAQDSLRRDLRVFATHPTSDEDRQHLLRTIHRVFELAQENCILRTTATRGLIEQMAARTVDDTWNRAAPEAQAFLFALTVAAEALAASHIAGESDTRLTALRTSFETSLATFQQTLDELETLYQRRLQENTPAQRDPQPLWEAALTPLPYHAYQGFQRHQQKKRHHRWKAAHDHAREGADDVRAALTSVGDTLSRIGDTPALGGANEQPLPLVVVLNGGGEVEEVYLNRDEGRP